MARGSIRQGARRSARQTDASPELVATARLLRHLLPGGRKAGEPIPIGGGQLRQRLGQLVVAGANENPSAIRELGLGVLQAWDTMSETQRRKKGTANLAILFTDLVGFSSWALKAGDDAALKLLREVGAAEKAAIAGNDGVLVKQLGDGSMAVFGTAVQAVEAAFEAQGKLTEVEVEGYKPQQRAGIHLGHPRKVGGDFLGVDVNIAARVADAARGGEVLVSATARATLDRSAHTFGRKRPLSAPGAPEDLAIYPVRRRPADSKS